MPGSPFQALRSDRFRQRRQTLGRQIGWSFVAKSVAALLQLLVIVQLARGLAPREFAFASSVLVCLQLAVAINGLGLVRQIQYRRSRDPDDPLLPDLFARRLEFTYASGLLWLVVTLVAYALTGVTRWAATAVLAGWLVVEQTTSVWNAISISDDRNQDLMPSYVWRRLPVVLILGLASWLGWNTFWWWTIGMTAGSAMALVRGWRHAPGWGRMIIPLRRTAGPRIDWDLGYWWYLIGNQARDLDLLAISAVSASAGSLYALPSRLVRPMNLLTEAAGAVAFPRLSRRHSISARELAAGVVVGSVPVMIIALVAAAAAPLVPDIVGTDYRATVPVLQILCLSAVVLGASTLVATFLQSRPGRGTQIAGQVTIIGGVVQIAAAAIGARIDGAQLASWAATGVQTFTLLGLYLAAARECRSSNDSQSLR